LEAALKIIQHDDAGLSSRIILLLKKETEEKNQKKKYVAMEKVCVHEREKRKAMSSFIGISMQDGGHNPIPAKSS
jgi:hypothetical protein